MTTRVLATSSLFCCLALLSAGFALAGAPAAHVACAPLSSCFVDADQAAACDDLLTLTSAERESDEALFSSWAAPEFELPSTNGRMLSLHSLRGDHVVLMLLSGDCGQSAATLAIVETLRNRFAGASLQFVPVFVKSGDVEELRERALEWDLPFSLVVSEDKAISQAYQSRVTPSTFLIDETGRVRRKLVGFKDEAALDAAIAELLADSYPPAPLD